MDRSTSTVVVAAGSSTRMGGGPNKVFLDLGGRSVLEHSLAVFSALPEIAEIVLVASSLDRERISGAFRNRLEELGVRKFVTGGLTRFESVSAGVAACDPDSPLVLIHDGARPYPPASAVREAIRAAGAMGAAILAIPLQDTLKRGDEKARIIETVPRAGLFRAQTPQVFQHAFLKTALASAREKGLQPTDDALLFEEAGHDVYLVPGDPFNLKITTQEDLLLARALLRQIKDRSRMP